MDYHLIPNLESPKAENKKYFSKLFKSFLPIFMLSALLPIFMAIVIAPPKLSFVPRADTKPQLRIWLEPASAQTSVGQPVSLEVFAQYENQNITIHDLSLSISSDSSLVVSASSLSFKDPFDGKVKIGEISAIPSQSGSFSVDIPREHVLTPIVGLDVITTSSVISVQ